MAIEMKSGEGGTLNDRINGVRGTFLPEGTLSIAMRAKAYRRFEGIKGRVEKLESEFKVQVYNKDGDTERLIMNSLRSNMMFNNYSEEQLMLIMRALKPRVTAKDEVLIKQGEAGYNFYVIQEGDFRFSNGKVHSAEYCFGELSLLFDSPRLLSVTSVGKGKVFYLERPVFQKILLNDINQREQEVVEVLKKVDFLRDFSESKLKSVFQKGHIQVYNEDDLVVRKGSKSKFFYIILSGRVKASNFGGNMVPTDLVEGEYFGESMINDNVRKANVRVISAKVELLVIDKKLMHDLNILNKILKFDFKVLNSVFIFNVLNEESRNRIKNCIDSHKCLKETTPLLQVRKHLVYIVKEGRALLGDRDLLTGSYLIPEKDEDVELVTAELSFYTIEKDEFDNVFSNLNNYKEKVKNFVSEYDTPPTGLLKFIVDNQTAVELYDNKKKSSKFNKTFRDLKSLKPLAVLGSGGYGTVSLVKNSTDEKIYALKAVSINRIVKKQAEANILHEKDVLFYCRHPFILRLFHTLKDYNNFYFIFEPVLGGDLFGYLYDQRDCLTCGQMPSMCDHNPTVLKEESVFYVGCVVEAFDYLHRNGILYRDLKPENLMIEADGYLKVVDFGFALRLTTARTYTLCGTLDYMAPEILLKSGHNRSVDCWAIGVLLYELLVGYPPFSKTRDQAERNYKTIFRNITKAKYNSAALKDEEARLLVSGLFVRDPSKRLGMSGERLEEIKEHDFFKAVDWSELKNKQLKPPWVPELRNEDDIRYFRTDSSSGSGGVVSLPTFNESVPKSRKMSLNQKGWFNEF